MTKSVSGRGKVRSLMKKAIKQGLVFTFWIYDMRKNFENNLWFKILEPHAACHWDEQELVQTKGYPKYRIIRFKCFSCSNKLCYWKQVLFPPPYSYPKDVKDREYSERRED
jgi:hypothetical protein